MKKLDDYILLPMFVRACEYSFEFVGWMNHAWKRGALTENEKLLFVLSARHIAKTWQVCENEVLKTLKSVEKEK